MSLVALLLALITAATGIDRTVDPQLAAMAERRVIEIRSDFSHAGADPCCAEVLAWNSGYTDPIARVVEQWRTSPAHWSILANPSYGAIGCALSAAAERTYAVCVLGAAATEQPEPEPEPEPVPAPTPAPAPGPPVEAERNGGDAVPSPSRAPSTSAAPSPAPLPILPDTAAAAP